MTFDSLLCHRATIHKMTEPGARDRYNNPDVEETLTVTDVAARFDSTTSDEDLNDRDQQTQRFIVFLRPPDAGLTGYDELTWQDAPGGPVRLKIEGDPLATYDASEHHHLELFAYRIRG